MFNLCDIIQFITDCFNQHLLSKQNFICYAHQGIAHAVFYLGDKLYSVKEKILKHNQPDISLVSA